MYMTPFATIGVAVYLFDRRMSGLAAISAGSAWGRRHATRSLETLSLLI
jgi:hypothetical protein